MDINSCCWTLYQEYAGHYPAAQASSSDLPHWWGYGYIFKISSFSTSWSSPLSYILISSYPFFTIALLFEKKSTKNNKHPTIKRSIDTKLVYRRLQSKKHIFYEHPIVSKVWPKHKITYYFVTVKSIDRKMHFLFRESSLLWFSFIWM